MLCIHNEDPTAPDYGVLGDYGDLYVCKRVVEPLEGETVARGPWCEIHRDGIVQFQLRDFQKVGIAFLKIKKRAMLTDAPGLGKTAQAALASEGRTLVVAPNYLTEQWYDWLCGSDEKSMERNHGKLWANVGGTKTLCVGNRYAKYSLLKRYSDWTVVNLEMFQTHQEEFKACAKNKPWQTMIIDESHHVKNYKSKRAKFAVQMGQTVENVYELTATPIWREADDLYMQFRILWPDLFKSYWAFIRNWCDVEENRFGVKIVGIKKKMMGELQELMNVMRLGRSYQDAGREIPPIIEKSIRIPLPDDVQKIYDDMVVYYRIQIEDVGEHKFTNWMQVFNALRRVVTGAFKVDAVAAILDDEVRKAVIFSWYQDTAKNIAERLKCPYIDGTVDVPDRKRIAQGPTHVSATIASLSEGVDASDARSVIFAEENWTPGSNYQALSRVRRERQGGDNKEPVIVYYVHCKGTIDEVIHARSKGREVTIKEIVRETVYK